MRVLLSLALLGVALTATPSSVGAIDRTSGAVGSQESLARPAARALQTGIFDPIAFSGSAAAASFARVPQTGATTVRLILSWRSTAPQGSRRPLDFDPANHEDPGYNWAPVDEQVKHAVANRLEPIVSAYNAPTWAERSAVGRPGARNPDPAQFGLFMRAAATRYSGNVPGLPRVRYWQVWNEPNFSIYYMPQHTAAGRVLSAAWYRDVVNAAADAVHGVHPSNLVIAGGLTPFTTAGSSPSDTIIALGPLRFMRELLCLSDAPDPRPTCSTSVAFDVWSHHPYSTGNPRRTAFLPEDVMIGDLPEMRAVLDAAVRLGHVKTRGAVRFWVTEFSWDSRPPDPQGVPQPLHAQWVAEALYRMWSAGVSLVTWFKIRDEEVLYQSGFFGRAAGKPIGPPKHSLTAFRFPFVAFRQGARFVNVWGRTPRSTAGAVSIEQRRRGRWVQVAKLRADRFGIFTGRLRLATRPADVLRARAGPKEVSLLFPLTPPPDRDVRPFGS